jgi:hypothetical protein
MSVDVEAELARIAIEWDNRALPIDAAEVMAAALSASTRAVDVVVETSTPTGARRRLLTLATAASLVVAIGLVAVIARREPTTVEPAEPVSPAMTIDSEPSATQAVSPDSAGATNDPPDTAASAPTPPSTPDPASAMDALVTERRAALAAYESVSFTAVVDEEYDGRPDMSTTRRNQVVLQANGSLYATGDSFIANSYDAATGIARAHFRNPDGTETYQEVVGLADNGVPLMTMLGSLDPTAPLGEEPDAEVTDGVFDGRSAWIVERDLGGQIDRWTVDRTSGLVLEYFVEWTFDEVSGAQARRTVHLTDVETALPMPPEFPYEFPAGVEVQRSGDPDGFRSLTLADAAAVFGPGLVAPADLPADSVITARSQDTSWSVPDPTAPSGSAELAMVSASTEITIREGFSRTTLYLNVLRSQPGATPPPGWIDARDGACPSANGLECDNASGDDVGVLSRGAWAGVNYGIQHGNLSASRDGVSLSISAGSDERALALAESLVAA